MIKDRKGIGGYMESLVALMAVTVMLTSFLGMLNYSELGKERSTISLDTDFIEDMKIENGEIVGETDCLIRFIDKYELNGARVIVNVTGNLYGASLNRTYGIADGNNADSRNGTFPIQSDDGRTFVASYEVVFWWN